MTLSGLKKSGVFPESWNVLAEWQRGRKRRQQWTKNNKSPGYPGWHNNDNDNDNDNNYNDNNNNNNNNNDVTLICANFKDIFIVVTLSNWLNKQSSCQWFEMPWGHCNDLWVYNCKIFFTWLSSHPKLIMHSLPTIWWILIFFKFKQLSNDPPYHQITWSPGRLISTKNTFMFKWTKAFSWNLSWRECNEICF